MVTLMTAMLWAWILVLGSGGEGKEMDISRMLDRFHTWCFLLSLCLSSSLTTSAGTNEFRNEQTSGGINKFVLMIVRSVHHVSTFSHKGSQVSIMYSDIPQSWGHSYVLLCLAQLLLGFQFEMSPAGGILLGDYRM